MLCISCVGTVSVLVGKFTEGFQTDYRIFRGNTILLCCNMGILALGLHCRAGYQNCALWDVKSRLLGCGMHQEYMKCSMHREELLCSCDTRNSTQGPPQAGFPFRAALSCQVRHWLSLFWDCQPPVQPAALLCVMASPLRLFLGSRGRVA